MLPSYHPYLLSTLLFGAPARSLASQASWDARLHGRLHGTLGFMGGGELGPAALMRHPSPLARDRSSR
eukprot:scaffold53762_cov49-Phaeocystis_antarctica.AAC.2